MARFRNRRDAGRSLGALLRTYASVHPLVVGLPRGGVVVAFEVARALDAQLDVFAVRTLARAGNEEQAMEALELNRREATYRAGRPAPDIAGRDVILVDDGMATGASMLVAVRALRVHGPRTITVAVPVTSREALIMVRNQADDWACVIAPEPFYGVGAWYEDFAQTTDEEVRELLARAASERHLVNS